MNIVDRSGWGAEPPTSRSTIPTPTPRLWLHHAATNTFGPKAVRGHQRYHMSVKGWNDIAYSFLIDRDGTVYEGRGAGIAGAHTEGDNRESHGICLLGSWHTRTPPAAQIDACAALVAYGYRRGWWPDRLTGGHRDAPGAYTSCPGDAAYRLIPDINTAATQEDDVSIASWAKAAVNKALGRGIFTKDTDMKSAVTPETLAVYLDRAGLLDHDNGPAIEHAGELKRYMDGSDSAPAYVREVIRHLRDHPSSPDGGLSEGEVVDLLSAELDRLRVVRDG